MFLFCPFSGGSGSRTFEVKSSKSLGIMGAKFESKNVTYSWKQVNFLTDSTIIINP